MDEISSKNAGKQQQQQNSSKKEIISLSNTWPFLHFIFSLSFHLCIHTINQTLSCYNLKLVPLRLSSRTLASMWRSPFCISFTFYFLALCLLSIRHFKHIGNTRTHKYTHIDERKKNIWSIFRNSRKSLDPQHR